MVVETMTFHQFDNVLGVRNELDGSQDTSLGDAAVNRKRCCITTVNSEDLRMIIQIGTKPSQSLINHLESSIEHLEHDVMVDTGVRLGLVWSSEPSSQRRTKPPSFK
jgi:hypothetical protein